MTVSDVANGLQKPLGEIIKKLMFAGIMATQNQTIDRDTVELIALEYDTVLQNEVVTDVTRFDEIEIKDDEKDLSATETPIEFSELDFNSCCNIEGKWKYSLDKGNCVQLPFEIGFCGNEDFSNPDKAVYTAQTSRDGIYNLIFCYRQCMG